jgi:hypothetical protein
VLAMLAMLFLFCNVDHQNESKKNREKVSNKTQANQLQNSQYVAQNVRSSK